MSDKDVKKSSSQRVHNQDMLARASRLETQLEYIKDNQSTLASLEIINKRLPSASNSLAKAMEILNSTNEKASYENRSEYYKHVIFSQVDVDTILKPEVDPNNGWVEHRLLTDGDSRESLFLDTQLMSMQVGIDDFHGQIRSLEYKPKKINLAHTENSNLSNEYLCTSVGSCSEKENDNEIQKPCTYSIIKDTPDVVCAQFSLPLSSQNTLKKNIEIRSGIGAHLNNSTTGFSIEYWIESDEINTDQLLCSSWTLTPKSEVLSACRIQPLLCVGAVSDESFCPDKEIVFDKNSISAGIYGLRFIDGVHTLAIDFRWSQAIETLRTQPKYSSDGQFEGLSIEFYNNARKLSLNEKQYFMFVSIV